jgi:hypothetical protein
MGQADPFMAPKRPGTLTIVTPAVTSMVASAEI